MNDVIQKYVSKLRSPKILIIAGIIGIALIYFSSFFTSKDTEKVKENTNISVEVSEYKKEIENDIAETVTQITGSKKVKVIVTLESGIKYSYADTKEETASDKTEKETQVSDKELKEGYITVKTADGGEQALLITEQMPEIRGVAIVCEGGDIETINEKIKNAVTAALDITSQRVYICGRR